MFVLIFDLLMRPDSSEALSMHGKQVLGALYTPNFKAFGILQSFHSILLIA